MRPHSSRRRWAPRPIRTVTLTSVMLTVACTTLAPIHLPASRTTRVEGGALQISSRGTGSPTVVFEAGAGSGMGVWRTVIEQVAPVTATFAYNRHGYGTSRTRLRLRSGQDVVELLRAGLEESGHRPPFVLVGHSLGGHYMNLFARLHPEEVVGVVLVDATPPGHFERSRTETPMKHSLLLASYGAGPVDRRYELTTIKNALSEIGAAPTFPPVPLVILTAGRTLEKRNAGAAAWMEMQQELAAMSPLGRQIVAEGSGHFIQRNDPDLVARSILELVQSARR